MTDMTVAIVEDDTGLRESLAMLLEVNGYPCRQYDSAESYLADADTGDVTCLLVDQHMAGMSGTDLLERLSAAGTLPRSVLFSARMTRQMAEEARTRGARAVMEKPIRPTELMAFLRDAGAAE
jgi:FixJ family two-component response regulator